MRGLDSGDFRRSLLFGYSSLIAVTYYGEIAFSYLWGIRIKIPYRWIFCCIILVGAALKVEVAWSIGDFFNGMMTLTNLIGVLGLTGVAITAIKSYLKEELKKYVPEQGQ